jgi:type I restriction enzyme S subunit
MMETAMATTAKFLKYPAYKDSGVEWLGIVPNHWKVEKGKWLFVKHERPVRPEDEIVTCFRDGQVTLRSNRRLDGFTNAMKEHGYQGIRVGDLVIHAMDAFAGAIGVSDSNGKSTPVYSACTERFPKTLDPFYYAYYLRSLAANGIIESLAKGIRERSTDFRFSDFGELLLASPPLPEQTAIAAFLDDKTSKIDQAIAQKEKLICLLKERKQIIIQNAVTKGLDPHAKMKDSGVDWIGEIPEGWAKPEKIKFISVTKGRLGWQGLKANEYTDEGPYILSSAHFNNHQIYWDQCPHVSLERYKLDSNIQLRLGDLLLMKDGAKMGKLAFVDHLPGLACLNSHLLLFRPKLKNGIDCYFPKYLFYLFQTDLFQDYVQINGTGSTFAGISQESIGNYQVCLPSQNQQIAIVRHIETQSTKIDTAIALQEKQITKLKEYKAVLIDGAVTGKIKVTNS